jgi:hypothetical protein
MAAVRSSSLQKPILMLISLYQTYFMTKMGLLRFASLFVAPMLFGRTPEHHAPTVQVLYEHLYWWCVKIQRYRDRGAALCTSHSVIFAVAFEQFERRQIWVIFQRLSDVESLSTLAPSQPGPHPDGTWLGGWQESDMPRERKNLVAQLHFPKT